MNFPLKFIGSSQYNKGQTLYPAGHFGEYADKISIVIHPWVFYSWRAARWKQLIFITIFIYELMEGPKRPRIVGQILGTCPLQHCFQSYPNLQNNDLIVWQRLVPMVTVIYCIAPFWYLVWEQATVIIHQMTIANSSVMLGFVLECARRMNLGEM